MLSVQIRIKLRLKLILNLVDLQQKMRPDTIQVCNLQSCFQQEQYCLQCFVRLIQLINPHNLMAQVLFHWVTERASFLTV